MYFEYSSAFFGIIFFLKIIKKTANLKKNSFVFQKSSAKILLHFVYFTMNIEYT